MIADTIVRSTTAFSIPRRVVSTSGNSGTASSPLSRRSLIHKKMTDQALLRSFNPLRYPHFVDTSAKLRALSAVFEKTVTLTRNTTRGRRVYVREQGIAHLYARRVVAIVARLADFP